MLYVFRSLLILCVINLISCGSSTEIPDPPPPPTQEIIMGVDKQFEPPLWSGKLHVATRELYFKDESREETHTDDPNDKRELLVRLFYPTDVEYSANVFPVFNPNNWDRIGAVAEEQYQLRKTNYLDAYWRVEMDAPLSTNIGIMPLVLFSHGNGRIPEEYIFAAAELASRGYMVASINHSYDSHYAEMPDGREFSYVGHGVDDLPGYSDFDREKLTEGLLLWSEDQIYILNQLSLLNNDSSSFLFSNLDTQRVMSLGHSFGGATTYLSAWRDDRIIASVDMDGGIWNSYDMFIDSPFMFIQAAQTYDLEIFNNVSADSYHVYLETPIHHGSFFDIALFWGWDFPDESQIELSASREILLTIVDLTDQFFMKYYQGNRSSMLDDGEQVPTWMTVTAY